MLVVIIFIAAIFAAAAVIAAIFPRFPHFDLADKLPISGVIRRLELDTAGDKYGKLRIYPRALKTKYRLFLSRIQKSGAIKASASLAALNSVGEKIFDALDALRVGIKEVYAHSGDPARTLAFCGESIRYARCDISSELFEKCVRTYYGNITENGRAYLSYALDYCILCAVLRGAATEERSALSRLRGEKDGKRGRTDVSALSDRAYVFGLCRNVADADRPSVNKLLEINGAGGCIEAYAAHSAQAYVDTVCALRSLSTPVHIDLTSDASYFGDGDYKISVLKNADVYLTADSRGTVGAEYKRKSHRIEIGAEIGGKSFELGLCDGVMQPHRTVFRSVDDAEFSVELVVPFDMPCVIAVVRTLGAGRARVYARSDAPRSNAKNCGDCIVAEDSFAFGLCAVSEKLARYAVDGGKMTAETEFCASPCKADRIVFAFAFSESAVSVERMFDMLRYPDSVDCALFGARVYSDCMRPFGVPALPQSAGVRDGDTDEFFGRLFVKGAPTYVYCDAERAEYELQTACGGFLSNGDYCVSSDEFDDAESFQAALRELAGDGALSVSIVSESDGKIILPFLRATVCARFGYIELSSRYCGEKYSLKRYRVSGDCEIYDLTVDCGCARNVMFSFTPTDEGFAEAVKKENSVYISTESGEKFRITCSHDISDFTPYLEGYSRHGMPNRTSGFGKCGICLMPAVSVRTFYDNRVILCVEKSGTTEIETVSASFADEALNCRTQIFGHAVKPLTFDKRLNFCYSRAFETAHASFVEDERQFISCFVEKYADPSTVRERITELLKSQSVDGQLHCGDDNMYAALVLPILVDEYVKRSGDDGFINVEIPFCDGAACDRSALSHCLRAIRYSSSSADDIFSLNLLFDGIMRFINRCGHTVRKKLTAYAARLKSEIDNFISRIGDCKMREQAEALIISALCSLNKKNAIMALDRVRTFCSARGESFVDVFGIDIALLYGFAEYGVGRYDKGYGIIREATEYFMCGSESCGVPRILQRHGCGHAAALYYMLVTDKLFGISMRREAVKLEPCISARTPHIEFELAGRNGKKHIVVDDGEGSGSWRLRMGRITCASNVIGDRDCSEFTLFRSESA